MNYLQIIYSVLALANNPLSHFHINKKVEGGGIKGNNQKTLMQKKMFNGCDFYGIL